MSSKSSETPTTDQLKRGRSGVRVVWLLLFAAACGGSDLFLPKDGEPARISALTETALTGTVGQPLGDSLVVQVTDPAGRPVSGVEVEFALPAGAAAEPGNRVVTGGDGQAAIAYTLGSQAGEQTVEARASAIEGPNGLALFVVSAAPDAPHELQPFAGNGQSAEVSTTLPESLAVRAVDQFGNGVPGVEVRWEITGGGQVSPASVITDAEGRAAAAFTLGTRPGAYGTTASADGLTGSPVSFRAIALGPQLALLTQPSATALAGIPLEQQPEIQLQDPFGAPLTQENVRVSVQIDDGGGALGGTTSALSNASGRVTFTDLELRGETGSRRLIFAAEGFTPVTSTAIVVRPGPPSPEQTTVSVGNGTAGSATAISIGLRDEFGNPISGAAGDLSIGISGVNGASGLAVSESGDGSYESSYEPVRSGRDEVTLFYRGEPFDGPAESIVAPGASDPSASTAEVTRSGVLFVQVTIRVTVRDAQGNPVGRGGDIVQIVPNGSATRTCVPNPQGNQCRDNGDGTYTDQFVIIANTVTVEITLNGVPLAGSPFTAR